MYYLYSFSSHRKTDSDWNLLCARKNKANISCPAMPIIIVTVTIVIIVITIIICLILLLPLLLFTIHAGKWFSWKRLDMLKGSSIALRGSKAWHQQEVLYYSATVTLKRKTLWNNLASNLKLVYRKGICTGVCRREEMINATWYDMDQR